jgi:acetyltransferase-like isoleucine patch superfamily enzyme
MNAAALAGPLRAFEALASRWALRHAASCGSRTTARGRVWLHGAGTVRLGDDVVLDGRWAPIELFAREGAELVLEDGVRLDGGVSIEAALSVRVGARTHLGRFCKLLDNHFHRTDMLEERPASQPIVVGPDVDVGVHAILLPGAWVGAGATIGPATVVARHVPPRARFAGLPAIVRETS